jgi:response regulator RpfG family c-di-GMP phosphodiesterase
MTTDRAYRKALTEDAAVNEILKMVGSQFDPEVVEFFMAVLNERKSARIERKTILVIEPDESVAAYLRLNLSGDFYNLSFATTASEALGLMSATEPALVIASHNSLQADNHIFYAKARLKAIPFIVFTEKNDDATGFPYHSVELLSKPVDVDELALKIKLCLRSDTPSKQQDTAEVPLKGVAGSLEDMSLTDIIQVLNMGMKTAKVVVTNGSKTGEIYLKSGKVTSAELGELTGCEAFYKLVEWSRGEFRVFHGHLTDKNNITVETMTLMLEATKVLDERRHAENGKVSP